MARGGSARTGRPSRRLDSRMDSRCVPISSRDTAQYCWWHTTRGLGLDVRAVDATEDVRRACSPLRCTTDSLWICLRSTARTEWSQRRSAGVANAPACERCGCIRRSSSRFLRTVTAVRTNSRFQRPMWQQMTPTRRSPRRPSARSADNSIGGQRGTPRRVKLNLMMPAVRSQMALISPGCVSLSPKECGLASVGNRALASQG